MANDAAKHVNWYPVTDPPTAKDGRWVWACTKRRRMVVPVPYWEVLEAFYCGWTHMTNIPDPPEVMDNDEYPPVESLRSW